MEYNGKPVHIITNDTNLIAVLLHYGLYIEAAAHDRTEEGKYHQHLLVWWEVIQERLSPARRTVIKRARRNTYCEYCTGKTFLDKCPICGLYYKLLWPKANQPERVENIRKYIENKISKDPTCDALPR